MRITFDTNALDKVSRPERFPKDPLFSSYHKLHNALQSELIQGFFSESVVFIDGVEKVDRAAVLGSTRLRQVEVNPTEVTSVETVQINLIVEDPMRKALHPEMARRIDAARRLGMQLLRAPRVGSSCFNDPDGTVYAADVSEVAMGERLSLYSAVARELEARGVGIALVKALGNKFSKRAGVARPWFTSLSMAQDIHEERQVQRAVAEWADGESIAAHISYRNDIFCTDDAAKSAGADSVLSAANRQWLAEQYGVRFATVVELAQQV